MPGAQPSPPEPEMMSLGETKVNEAKKGLEDKMKEVKSFKGNKKKETKKAKTDKIINAVQENEDQKVTFSFFWVSGSYFVSATFVTLGFKHSIVW